MGNSKQHLPEKSHLHLSLCLSAWPYSWSMSAKQFLEPLIQNRRAIKNCACLCSYTASATHF